MGRRIVLRALSLLIIAAGSWLTPAHAWAQTTRAYQMTLLGSVDAQQEDPRPPINYNVPVDIPTFYFGREATPPSGPMIVWLPPEGDLQKFVEVFDVLDWSRVVAVYVDEPYLAKLDSTPGKPACNSAAGAPLVQGMTNTLQTMALAVRGRAPKARFWVNFNWQEVDWMANRGCVLNHDFIDVVSVDLYGRHFNNIPPHIPTGVRVYYDYLGAHRPVPHQQFALIPGTHVSQEQDAFFGATVLREYFDYAQDQNQTCGLPLGPQGVTGFYDGCPVWMVAGFVGGASAFTDTNNFTLYPIEHPDALWIREVWEETVAKPRNPPPPDTSSFNRLWVPAVLKLLLN